MLSRQKTNEGDLELSNVWAADSSRQACSCAITYCTHLKGTATEEDVRALTELRENDWHTNTNTGLGMGSRGGGLTITTQGRTGDLVPVHAAISVGPLTVERKIVPNSISSSVWPIPERIDSTRNQLVTTKLIEAIKADDSLHAGSNVNKARRRRRRDAISRAMAVLCKVGVHRRACASAFVRRSPCLPLTRLPSPHLACSLSTRCASSPAGRLRGCPSSTFPPSSSSV